MTTWQIEEAETRLSEVTEHARTEGPQTITAQGTACAVVLSINAYVALTAQKPDFTGLLLGGPKSDEFLIARSDDCGREGPI
jgi:prevent-host-death family protein